MIQQEKLDVEQFSQGKNLSVKVRVKINAKEPTDHVGTVMSLVEITITHVCWKGKTRPERCDFSLGEWIDETQIEKVKMDRTVNIELQCDR